MNKKNLKLRSASLLLIWTATASLSPVWAMEDEQERKKTIYHYCCFPRSLDVPLLPHNKTTLHQSKERENFSHLDIYEKARYDSIISSSQFGLNFSTMLSNMLRYR